MTNSVCERQAMAVRDPLSRCTSFPAEAIVHDVRLYFGLSPSLWMVECSLAAQGTTVSHQTAKLSTEKFGRSFVNEIRRRPSVRLGGQWNLGEAAGSIRGKKHWPTAQLIWAASCPRF